MKWNKIFSEKEIKINGTTQPYPQRPSVATWSMFLTLLYTAEHFTVERYKHTHIWQTTTKPLVRFGTAFK